MLGTGHELSHILSNSQVGPTWYSPFYKYCPPCTDEESTREGWLRARVCDRSCEEDGTQV